MCKACYSQPLDFFLGDTVAKQGGDYTFIGKVVAAFHKLSGKQRYVVEDDRGTLHVFGPSNLRIATEEEENEFLGAHPSLFTHSENQQEASGEGFKFNSVRRVPDAFEQQTGVKPGVLWYEEETTGQAPNVPDVETVTKAMTSPGLLPKTEPPVVNYTQFINDLQERFRQFGWTFRYDSYLGEYRASPPKQRAIEPTPEPEHIEAVENIFRDELTGEDAPDPIQRLLRFLGLNPADVVVYRVKL